ncbi:MAG: MBL fold metallo-hydrolase [Rhizobiaceae bacterium]|jgi:L-ascorbate metabolism protein UlaG (beta-lactamase superfamily)
MAGNPYYSGPVSDHFDGSAFFNPEGVKPRPLRELLKWQFGGGRAKWPTSWPSPFEPARPAQRIGGGRLRVTMVGHATLLVQVGDLNILTDPVWSRRASPFSFAGPKRVNEPGIRFADLPPIDLVLLSHNHYDHLDGATLARLQASHDPLVVTPLGNDTIVRRYAPGMRIHAGDWGDRVEIGGGVTVHFEPAHHWSARGTRDRRMALWSAFAIETPSGKIYHVGDTGFHGGRNYRAAAEKHGAFRLAILPIGAYEPRWFMAAQHQDPEEAVEGMRLANAAFAVGHHWGTFQLTNEPIEEPRDRLHEALDRAGMVRRCFRAMRPGEAWDVPEQTANATNRLVDITR